MTRINCGIPVAELTNKHLLAEHREIKRIPNVIKSGKYNLHGQPKEFTLGTGHVKFFYSRLRYLLNRYHQIHKECKSRGFNVTDYSGAWNDMPVDLMNDYQPTQRDMVIVRERINERLNKKSNETNSKKENKVSSSR